MAVLDLRTIRYITLLDDTSGVKTSKCFQYNNLIIFAVHKNLVSRAIGANAVNVRKIQDKLERKIRIMREAEGLNDAERFIKDIIAPVNFNSVEVKDFTLVLNAGSMNKASLIGRNRKREEELALIVKDTFGMELKIV